MKSVRYTLIILNKIDYKEKIDSDLARYISVNIKPKLSRISGFNLDTIKIIYDVYGIHMGPDGTR